MNKLAALMAILSPAQQNEVEIAQMKMNKRLRSLEKIFKPHIYTREEMEAERKLMDLEFNKGGKAKKLPKLKYMKLENLILYRALNQTS